MKWLFHVCVDLFDDRPDFVVVLDPIKKEQELVTADARQHVAVAKALCNAPGDLQEKRIADRVAVIVIDVLEVIQVDKSQRKPAVLVAKNPVDMFPNENAVWKGGQVIEVDALQELVLDHFALGDIERAREQEGLIKDANGLMPR